MHRNLDHLIKFTALSAFIMLAQGTGNAASLEVLPNTISNDYTGVISLKIGGLTNGETVIVEKFTDFNANGSPENADFVLQAFPLKDGEATVFGGITNLHVPGDLNPSGGSITAELHMGVISFEQRAVGKQLYRVSSPTGRFTPVSVPFTVTNSSYATQLSGRVTSSGTNVPYALIVLFRPSNDGGVAPQTAGATDASGNYSLKVPAGLYMVTAFKSNYVCSFATAPILDLASGAKVTTNLALLPATRRITGRVSDAADPLHGLGGLLTIAQSSSGQVGFGTTDRNGSFSIGVTAGVWEVGPDDTGLHFLGYPGKQTKLGADCTSSDATGLAITLSEGNAMIYGTVRTDASAPLTGVVLYGQDGGNQLSLTPRTDEVGRYFAPVVSGYWEVGIGTRENQNFAGYVFSESANNIQLQNGAAVLQDFTAKNAPYLISGYLKDTSQKALDGIQIWGSASLDGISYHIQALTDNSGFFTMRACNGQWDAGAACDGNEGLRARGYSCAANTFVTVANANAAVSLWATPCGTLRILTGSLVSGKVNGYYSQHLDADSCQQNLTWSLNPNAGRLPNGLSMQSWGDINGTPTEAGTFNFTVRVSDGAATAERAFSLNIEPDQVAILDITTWSLSNGTNGSFYSAQLSATGGRPPYTWSLAPGSASLPQNLLISSDGQITGTPTVTGQFYFRVRVTDSAMATHDQQLALQVTQVTQPLGITTTSLPPGTSGIPYSSRIEATGGQPPYWWGIAMGSAPLPAGLSLNTTTGEIFGTPSTTGTFYFITYVNDSATPVNSDEQLLTLAINPGQVAQPALNSPSVGEDGKFRFLINGLQGARYTIQFSPDMLSWADLRTTNALLPSFTFVDDAPNRVSGYYRVRVEP